MRLPGNILMLLFLFVLLLVHEMIKSIIFTANQKETILDLLSGIATLKVLEFGPCPFLLAARILKI